MYRYYCSGFDVKDAFGHGLGDMFKNELKDTKSIVYIPGGINKLEKVKTKYLPAFREYFKKVGIIFEEEHILDVNMDKETAKEIIDSASFILLMGGDPFEQKEICESLEVMDNLRNYNGVMVGFSAGAMLMSKYIIITPVSDEYPDFHIENGLNLDGISIYPHNNTSLDEYPDKLVVGDETTKRDDLLRVAREYGEFYLLQDNLNEDKTTSVSLIKSVDGTLSFYTEYNGKVWKVTRDSILLEDTSKKNISR